MILDILSNWRKYNWSSERFGAGFHFLERMSPGIEVGTYHIDGENVYCMVQGYDTKPVDEGKFESHRDYADIQLVLEGVESILWAPRTELTVTTPYKPDIEFQELRADSTDLVLRAGHFAVFMPDDSHAPCLAHGAPAPVKKAVVKVRLGA